MRMCSKYEVVTCNTGRGLFDKYLDQIRYFEIIDNDYLNIKIELYIINNETSYTLNVKYNILRRI